MNKITQLGEGASAYLTGQHHNWQVVPPARRPPTQSSPPKDVYAEVCFPVMLYTISFGGMLCPNLNTLSVFEVVGSTASSLRLVPKLHPPTCIAHYMLAR